MTFEGLREGSHVQGGSLLDAASKLGCGSDIDTCAIRVGVVKELSDDENPVAFLGCVSAKRSSETDGRDIDALASALGCDLKLV